MTDNAQKHPDREQLWSFGLGKLGPDESEKIAQHVDDCVDCSETIVNLQDDTFVSLVRSSPAPAPVDQSELEAGEGQAAHPDVTVDVESGATGESSPPAELPPELRNHPRYEILSLIGRGGMGDVYEAKHRMMDRTVALKIIKCELVRKTEAVDRFHREVKTAARLAHPNIVTAHDAEQAGNVHFMVMEYVDGVNLSQIVNEKGAMPIREACEYIRQAATGMQYAHEKGMVHRDIKPHNLMVTSNGTVKILDFGLASLAPKAIADADTVEARGDLTAVGAIMGTPDFISPEQADDARKADIRSDIYSLGATLYFLLAGRPPFAEGSLTQKLKSHAQAAPEPLESLRDDVPPELVAVVTRMAAKDPAERFQTPAEVAKALKSFSRSVEPREDIEPPAQAKPRRWKPTFLSLTAVAAMFVAALFAGVVYYVQTDHGVVRIEVTDPSLQVTISDENITMKDGEGKSLKIRPGEEKLVVRNDDADFEFETNRFQIRRGDKIAFKVEMTQGEIVVRKDGERFNSKAPSDDLKVQQILDRMVKVYAECKSYRDTGVIKTVFVENADSPPTSVEHLFTTLFVRPDRFRFEITEKDDDRLVISVNGPNVQTWWDVEPGIQRPESLELAMAQALGFAGADVGRIPTLLMPEKLEGHGDLNIIDPKQIEDGKLRDVECFRLEYNFRDEQIVLWIDKQSYLVRQIDERMKFDGIRTERTTTYDPSIDEKITGEMLEFLPQGDLKQLQGDWNVIAFTQDGEKEFAVDKRVSMQLHFKGNTLTRSQTGRNGKESEREWGRIKLGSTTDPKSIDIISPDSPDSPDDRLLGIYELKDGALRICFNEQSDIDVDEGRTVKRPKRPTTFNAPAGSENVLIECRRKGRADAQTYKPSPATVKFLLDLDQDIKSRKSPWGDSEKLKKMFYVSELREAIPRLVRERLKMVEAGKEIDIEQTVNELRGLAQLFQTTVERNEATYNEAANLAATSWPLLLAGYPEEFNEVMVELTAPYPAIRYCDERMEKGIPSEALGWDVQAAHAIALARAGKTEEALKENQALTKKIDFAAQHGAIPDLSTGYFGKQRSKQSLLKQALLQKSLILAIAGRTVESEHASAVADDVEDNHPTEDDQPAIQAMLDTLAKLADSRPAAGGGT